jgi:hypothetical protein
VLDLTMMDEAFLEQRQRAVRVASIQVRQAERPQRERDAERATKLPSNCTPTPVVRERRGVRSVSVSLPAR